MNKHIYKYLSLLCLCAFIASAAYLIRYLVRHNMQKTLNANVTSLYLDSLSENDGSKTFSVDPDLLPKTETDIKPAVNEDASGNKLLLTERESLLKAEAIGRRRFNDLLKVNEDYLGMVLIDGLDISLPFVQGGNNDLYLNINFNQEPSDYGTVFLSCYNDRLLTDKNMVLFGHYKRDGSMFTPLVEYRDMDTVLTAPTIVLDSLVGKSVWLVFAAYVCETDYDYISPMSDDLAFADFLQEIHERSIFHTNVEVTDSDQVLTLSTCTYEFQDARFAVHARKLREGEVIPDVTVQKNPNQKPYKVPNQKKLSAVKANNTAVMRHPASSKTYYYQVTNNSIEYYVGNTSLVQGGYTCFTAELPKDSVVSAAYDPNGKTRLAVERINKQAGIFLLESETAAGTFSLTNKSPVTPEGIDARFPLLDINNNERWLFYTVTGERDEIYRLDLKSNYKAAGEAELIVAADKDAGLRAVGTLRTDEGTLLVWQEKASKSLFGTWLNPLPNAEEAVVAETIRIPYDGKFDRIIFYGSTGKTCSIMTESNGRLVPGTFDIRSLYASDESE